MTQKIDAIPHLSLHSLNLLVIVANSKSITKAAESAHLSPSAVSKRIMELEQLFGAVLFKRTSNGMVLTSAGRVAHTHALAMLQQFANLKSGLATVLSREMRHIKIASNTTAILIGLLDEINRFRNEYGYFSISLVEDSSAAVVQAVIRGDVDLGVALSNYAVSNLQRVRFRKINLRALMPSTHPLAGKAVIAPVVLQQYPIVWMPPIVEGSLDYRRHMDSAYSTNLTIRSFNAIISAVRGGAGIAVLPDPAVPTALSPELTAVRIDGTSISLYLMTNALLPTSSLLLSLVKRLSID